MNMIINLKQKTLTTQADGEEQTLSLYSKKAFELLSDLWLKVSWDQKYSYTFSWMGRPIIQLPEDIIRMQEVIYRVKPDVIIETGIAHGGSLIFYASLCKLIGKGRVIGIDIEIRPHNRKAIEAHELFEYITLIEGNSIDPKIVDTVKSLVSPGESAIVILDSRHTKEHVLTELRAYSELISLDSYIVACDGIMEQVVGVPRSSDDWSWNNPKAAEEEFVKENNDFLIEEPKFLFNEGMITERVTYWKSGFLRRVK